MNTSIPTVKQLAEEAASQLICAREQISWFSAIVRAIALDVEHGEGRNVRYLTALAQFLDDTTPAVIEQAIDRFDQVAAPQSDKSPNVACASVEGRP